MDRAVERRANGRSSDGWRVSAALLPLHRRVRRLRGGHAASSGCLCSARNGLSSLLRLVRLWRAYELVAESQEDARQQRLGEDVSDLLLRADPLQGDAPPRDLLADEVVADVDVLAAAVQRVRVAHGDGGLVVAQHQRHGGR